jgi:hypothetical protein
LPLFKLPDRILKTRREAVFLLFFPFLLVKVKDQAMRLAGEKLLKPEGQQADGYGNSLT